MERTVLNAMEAEQQRRAEQVREWTDTTIAWILRNTADYTKEQLEAMSAPELKSIEINIKEANEPKAEIKPVSDEHVADAAARFRARFGGESKMVIKSKKRRRA